MEEKFDDDVLLTVAKALGRARKGLTSAEEPLAFIENITLVNGGLEYNFKDLDKSLLKDEANRRINIQSVYLTEQVFTSFINECKRHKITPSYATLVKRIIIGDFVDSIIKLNKPSITAYLITTGNISSNDIPTNQQRSIGIAECLLTVHQDIPTRSSFFNLGGDDNPKTDAIFKKDLAAEKVLIQYQTVDNNIYFNKSDFFKWLLDYM